MAKTPPTKPAKLKATVTKAKAQPGDKRLGNNFWESRSSHGRKAIFTSPKKLADSARQYFEWCDENPFMKSVVNVVSIGQGAGSSVELTEVPVKRPYSLGGFCLFCSVNDHYWRDFKKSPVGLGKGFPAVIRDIEMAIMTQQVEGAQSGFFKENITSRINGLAENQKHSGKIESVPPVVQYITPK